MIRRETFYTSTSPIRFRRQKTITIVPGVHADFDSADKLIGMEVLDASEVVGGKIEFP